MNAVRHPGVIATALVLAALPLVLTNAYYFDVAIRLGLAGIAALGLNLLFGYAGQVSIGHAAFVALGAYGSSILSGRGPVPPVISVPLAVAAVALVAALIGRPILRLQGHALAVATLGLGIIVNIVLVNEVAWTGGPDGMDVPPLGFSSFALTSELHWYAVVAVLLLLTVAASRNLQDSPAGRALRALNGSEVAAQSSGVDTARMKLRVFVISAMLAGLSGALTAHYAGFVTPDLSGFMRSVELLTMVVVGGRGSTFGVLGGVVLVGSLPQLLGGYDQFEMCSFGLILMGTIVFMPRGLGHALALPFVSFPSRFPSWRRIRFSK